MQKTFRQKIQDLVESGEIYTIADNVSSASDIVRLLGYTVAGSRTSIVTNTVRENDIDISHWRVSGTHKAETVTKKCPICTKNFTFFAREPRTTCSHSCANTYFRSKENNPNWKQGSSSYRKHAFSTHGVICNKCGYSENINALVVHHKDRNRNNNDISNLEVLCCNCHAIEHYSDKVQGSRPKLLS